MSDQTRNPQVTDNNMKSRAVEKLNEIRDSEPVSPTPTTEQNKSPENNELSDNELKAQNELAELERLHKLHITDDQHKVDTVKEQLEYERGQREQRSEQDHADEVTQRQHEKFKAEQGASGNKK